MIRLLLVRHGETDWNREGRYQGRTDVELNEVGIQQAHRLAQRLSSERISAVYSSDLKRATRTASIIVALHNVEVTFCEDLRELDMGEFEGKALEKIKDQYMALEQRWRQGDWSVGAPGGETLDQMRERIDNFIAEIKERRKEGTILVVAHGGALRTLICRLVGIDYQYWWRMQLSGASISIIDVFPERSVIVQLNDRCHLDG